MTPASEVWQLPTNTGAIVEITDAHSTAPGAPLVAEYVTINGVDAGLIESVTVNTDPHEVVRVTVVLLPSQVTIRQASKGD